MEDREQLKRTLGDSLDVLVRAKRIELKNAGADASEVGILQWCRSLLESSYTDVRDQPRLLVSEDELRLRREVMEELIEDRLRSRTM